MNDISKIELDKYYTPKELAEYIINKTKQVIDEENITEYLEPSAGNGVFLDLLDKPYLAYDIEPEDKLNRIVQQDYLTLDIAYKKGRCIIGNPPYGKGNTLSVKFYKKSIQLGDYIAFILPATQYKNNQQMYEFDIIHSEIINNKGFTDLDKRVKLCFNIYKRPTEKLNSKPNYKLKDFEIIEVRNGNKIVSEYDIRIMTWGGSIKGGNINIGKEVDYPNQYAREFCIIVHNKKYKQQILNLIKNANWRDIYYMPSPPSLNQWQIYKYIKEQIPNLN